MKHYFVRLLVITNLYITQAQLGGLGLGNLGGVNLGFGGNIKNRSGLGFEASLNGAGLNFNGNIGAHVGATASARANAGFGQISRAGVEVNVHSSQGVPSPRVTLENLVEEEWNEFKLTYNKVYDTAEAEAFRREIFIENRAKIARGNQEYSLGRKTFVLQLNPFGDLLNHEFNRLLNGFNKTRLVARPRSRPTTFIPSANVVIPESVDWRKVGAVTSVKNQGQCADCWAFAAVGALEGHHFRKTSSLVELSAQNLLDCTRSYGNEGCSGGTVDPAFEYVKENNGIDTEESYPYEGNEKECRFKPEGVGAYCTGFVDIAENDEEGLKMAVATLGPVAVAIDASSDQFQFYSNGVYYNPECKNTLEEMNHAVLVVGYGEEANSLKYWLIKNTYGPQWGIGGYLKMARGINHCGIATTCSYPLV